jgi:hypothetical protein
MKPHGRSLLLAMLLLETGCMEGAKLARVTDTGGVVTYPLKKDRESIYQPFRDDALKLIEERCQGGYIIVREGETKGHRYTSGREDSDEGIASQRFWGLEFRCK